MVFKKSLFTVYFGNFPPYCTAKYSVFRDALRLSQMLNSADMYGVPSKSTVWIKCPLWGWEAGLHFRVFQGTSWTLMDALEQHPLSCVRASRHPRTLHAALFMHAFPLPCPCHVLPIALLPSLQGHWLERARAIIPLPSQQASCFIQKMFPSRRALMP